jgi:hypothetical protein
VQQHHPEHAVRLQQHPPRGAPAVTDGDQVPILPKVTYIGSLIFWNYK